MTEKTVIGKIEILEDGQIQVRQDRVVIDDNGKEVARLYTRYVLEPGQEVPKTDDGRLETVCKSIWTDSVITSFQTTKAEQLASQQLTKESI